MRRRRSVIRKGGKRQSRIFESYPSRNKAQTERWYHAAAAQATLTFIGGDNCRRSVELKIENGHGPSTKMIPENQNKALHGWQTSARYWDKYRVLITEMFAPLTSGLVEEAQIGIGQKVLDIGGGGGEPSLTISSIVGPAGSVTYTDPVAGMLESAQAEAKRRDLTNIHFRRCSADDLPFADCTFDVAVARLSAMFFVDPVTAVRERLRVVLKDGRVVFAVWGPKGANPFFSSITDVIDQFLEVPSQDPDAPDAFRFAVPGNL